MNKQQALERFYHVANHLHSTGQFNAFSFADSTVFDIWAKSIQHGGNAEAMSSIGVPFAIRRSGVAALNKLFGVLPSFSTRARAQFTGSSSIVSGLLAPYNSPSANLGGFVEVFTPGCFAKWLARNPDYRILFNHTPSMLLGRQRAGTAAMWDTDDGLAYAAVMPKTSYAADLAELLERKDVSEASVAMWVIKDRWATVNGVKTRYIEEAALLEGSVEPFAAYSTTTADIETVEEETGTVAEEQAPAASASASASVADQSESLSVDVSDADFDFDLDTRLRQIVLV